MPPSPFRQPDQPAEQRHRLSGEQRRALILLRAKEVFAQHSYGEATTSLLARASGVTEPMLYKHFGSKKALFLAVLEHFGEQLLGAWEQRIDHRAQEDVQSALVEAMIDLADIAKTDPDALRVIFQGLAAAADEPEFGMAVARYSGHLYRIIYRLMERVKAAGLIAPNVDLGTATLGYVSVAYTVQIGLMLSRQPDGEGEQRVRDVLQLWTQAIMPRSES